MEIQLKNQKSIIIILIIQFIIKDWIAIGKAILQKTIMLILYYVITHIIQSQNLCSCWKQKYCLIINSDFNIVQIIIFFCLTIKIKNESLPFWFPFWYINPIYFNIRFLLKLIKVNTNTLYITKVLDSIINCISIYKKNISN